MYSHFYCDSVCMYAYGSHFVEPEHDHYMHNEKSRPMHMVCTLFRRHQALSNFLTVLGTIQPQAFRPLSNIYSELELSRAHTSRAC